MKHPEREEWIPYLFGESDPEVRRRLGQHLSECAECSREIAAWRRSLDRLDEWSLPKRPANVLPLFQPMLKWALAASLVLGAGVLMGRATAPAPVHVRELRAQVEASVRTSMNQEWNERFRQFQVQTSNSLSMAEIRLAKAATVERQRVWHEFLEVLTSARTDDARALQAALQVVQERHETEFVALRKDLETLASMTDNEIRDARRKLVQLAGYQAPSQ